MLFQPWPVTVTAVAAVAVVLGDWVVLLAAAVVGAGTAAVVVVTFVLTLPTCRNTRRLQCHSVILLVVTIYVNLQAKAKLQTSVRMHRSADHSSNHIPHVPSPAAPIDHYGTCSRPPCSGLNMPPVHCYYSPDDSGCQG